MAKEWIAVIEGKQHGPLSNSELKSLADSKRLMPTDHVWKEGMTEWVPAIKIKGLFTVPPPLAPTNVPTRAPSQPDVASAAKDFFGAVAGVAKRAGVRAGQAVEKATQKSALSDPDDAATEPAASTPKVSRRNLVIGAISVGGLLLSCIVCGVVIGPLKTGGGQKATESGSGQKATPGVAVGEIGELSSFTDLPPPVAAAAKSGRSVWELTDWNRESWEKVRDQSLYLVIDNGILAGVYKKIHHERGSAAMEAKGRNREIIQWYRTPIDMLSQVNAGSEQHWRLVPAGDNKHVLTSELRGNGEGGVSTITITVDITLDPMTGRGSWGAEQRRHIKFHGKLAHQPEVTDTKSLAGGGILAVKAK